MHILQSDEFKELLFKNILYVLLGFLLVGGCLGFLVSKQYLGSSCNLAVAPESTTSDTTAENSSKELEIDLSGAINNPGVYTLKEGARLSDLFALGGGFTNTTSASWVSKNMNLSKPLIDSSKIYVPFEWEVASEFTYTLLPLINEDTLQGVSSPGSDTVESTDTTTEDTPSGTINVNTASLDDLDALQGIGQSYAQKIIDNRPYSNFEEFKENSKIPQSTAENIKDLISY